jgi:hypothetical protein
MEWAAAALLVFPADRKHPFPFPATGPYERSQRARGPSPANPHKSWVRRLPRYGIQAHRPLLSMPCGAFNAYAGHQSTEERPFPGDSMAVTSLPNRMFPGFGGGCGNAVAPVCSGAEIPVFLSKADEIRDRMPSGAPIDLFREGISPRFCWLQLPLNGFQGRLRQKRDRIISFVTNALQINLKNMYKTSCPFPRFYYSHPPVRLFFR